MVRLTVDCMKRNHLCWNRKGAIGKQMKAVHWVLFVIAWLKGSTDDDPGTVQLASSASPLSSRLMELVSFFQRFKFDEFAVDASMPLGFVPRRDATDGSRPPVVLCDPLCPAKNLLANRIDEAALFVIRGNLQTVYDCLQADCQRFYAHSWNFPDDGRTPAATAQPPPPPPGPSPTTITLVEHRL